MTANEPTHARPRARIPGALVAAMLVAAVALTAVPERSASAQEAFTATATATAPTTIEVGWTNPPPTALGVVVRFHPAPYDAAREAEVPADPAPASGLTWNEAVPGTTYDVEVVAVLPDLTEVPAAAVVRVVTPVATGPQPTPVTGASVMDLFSDSVWVEWPETGLPGERIYLRVDTVPADPARSHARWAVRGTNGPNAGSGIGVLGLDPETTYTAQIWAVADDGTFSDPVVPAGMPVTTPPYVPPLEPPLDLAVAATPTTLHVTWATNPSGTPAERYYVEIVARSRFGAPTVFSAELDATATEVLWDEALPGEEYHVRFQVGGGWQSIDADVAGSPVTTPVSTAPKPGPPIGAAVTYEGDRMTVSWAPNPSGPPPVRYRVVAEDRREYEPEHLAAWVPASPDPSAELVARPGGTYDVTLWAISADEAFSDPVVPQGSPITLYRPTPEPPVDVTVRALNSRTLEATWAPAPGGTDLPRYTFSIEGPGIAEEYDVGYNPAVQWGGLQPGATYRIRVQSCVDRCSAAVPAEGLAITMPADLFAISGVVRGPTGAPLAEAVVGVFGPGDTWWPRATVTTGPDGTYAVEGLPALWYSGWYKVLVVPPEGSGLDARWAPGTASRDGARFVSEAYGGTAATDVDVTFAPLSSVSGTVRGPAGPLAGATVKAFLPTDGWFPSFTTTTGPDGTWALAVDAGTSVQVVVQPPAGSELTPRWYPGVRSRAGATGVAVGTVPVAGVDFSWDSSSTVSGVVTGPGGIPVAGARVSAFGIADTSIFSSASTVTDASGRYTLADLVPDGYQIRAAPPAASGVAPCWHPAAVNRTLAPRVVVGGSQALTGIDVSCPAA